MCSFQRRGHVATRTIHYYLIIKIIYSIFEISVKYQCGSNTHTKLRILVSVTSVVSLTNCQVFYVVSIFHVSRLGARGVKDKREYTVTNGGAISAYVSVMHNTINRLQQTLHSPTGLLTQEKPHSLSHQRLHQPASSSNNASIRPIERSPSMAEAPKSPYRSWP